MSQEIIDTGSLPNDGNGDPLRTAFDKINNNFANLFTLAVANPNAIQLLDPTANQTLGSSFNQINNNFANLFSLVTNNPVDPVVEVINTNSTTPTGNINNLNIGNVYITNKFDSRANNPVLIRQKAKLPSTTTIPVSINEALGTVGFGPFGNQEYINIGETPNDGNGDPLRTAFSKINNNFSNLFLTISSITTSYTAGTTPNQVVFETPIARFYQGEFQIRSSDLGSTDMQDITLSASITNNLAGVRFSGHSTLFDGNAICRYDMDVSGGFVRILINPLVNSELQHFISASITYPDAYIADGSEIELDGYSAGFVMGTETDIILTTES